MSVRQIAAGFVLADFTALTAWAMYQDGWAMLTNLWSSATGILVTFDLLIALGFVVYGMIRHARARGVSPTPYVVATLMGGSIGPLLYATVAPASEAEPKRAALAA